MSDRTSQLVAANPEVLLRRGLDILQEGRGMLTTMAPGCLNVSFIQLEDAVEDLYFAAQSLDFRGIDAQGRERCLLLARSLRRQSTQFEGLLNGWLRFLTGWHQIRECHEHGYTAAGAPSSAPASVRSRGEL
jgi:hypothetical protein